MREERKITPNQKSKSKPKSQNKINNTKNLFILKKIKKEIKDRIIRDIRTLFETEEKKKKERN